MILLSILTMKVIMILSTPASFVKQSLFLVLTSLQKLSVVTNGIITANQDSEDRLNLSNQGNNGEIMKGNCKCIYFIGSILNDQCFNIMLLYGFV